MKARSSGSKQIRPNGDIGASYRRLQRLREMVQRAESSREPVTAKLARSDPRNNAQRKHLA
jgi:hypothetical protein